MIEVSLTNNALLQLNILLWMSLPGRKEWINPFFYKKGFEIKAIEPELSLLPSNSIILKAALFYKLWIILIPSIEYNWALHEVKQFSPIG